MLSSRRISVEAAKRFGKTSAEFFFLPRRSCVCSSVLYYSVDCKLDSLSTKRSKVRSQLNVQYIFSTRSKYRQAMAPSPTDSKRIAEAQKFAKTDPHRAEAMYKDILSKGPGSGEAAMKDYETALMGLGTLYRDEKKSNELSELVTNSRSTLSSFAKAKTAKIGKGTALFPACNC